MTVRQSLVRTSCIALLLTIAACGPAPAGALATPAAARHTSEPTAAPSPATVATAIATPMVTPAPDWNALPVAANDPATLAQQLIVVEAGLRDLSVTGPQLRQLGHLEQLIFNRLVDHPEWHERVLAPLQPAVRVAVANGLKAIGELRTMHGPIPSRLPAWQIVEPTPIDELLGYYREAEAAFGVSWEYLAAIHLVETRMGRIRGLSSAGAQGPMQFMPATWAAYGRGDVNDTRDAIHGAARYLRASGAPGNMQKALYAYNQSQAYVNAIVAYAETMRTDAKAYRGYHGWQVYYPTKDGPMLLPVGWTNR